MRILAVDVGTGTQDIFLFDSRFSLENGFKLVVPSPTMIVHHRLREATRRGKVVVLTGVTMGGGPSTWAAEEHLRAGLELFATPDAARSFNDDIDAVQSMGVRLISEEDVIRLPDSVLKLELKDFDFEAIASAFGQFGVDLQGLDAIAVAVFDHGNSPPGYSDRQFRFDYLDQRIRQQNRLSAFAYLDQDIPPIMTRLQAVAESFRQNAHPTLENIPLVVMDTAPAAILGATFDPKVRNRQRLLVVNLGNFHTLAFRLGPSGIEAVFEHHTGLLELPELERLLCKISDSSLKHEEVFDHHGHGALVYDVNPLPLNEGDFGVVVTGPQRNLMRSSSLRPYFAVPFGDMMVAGCFGLLAATAELLPELGDMIRKSMLGGEENSHFPWDNAE